MDIALAGRVFFDILSEKVEEVDMKPDSRVEDILHTLSDPEKYVRGILASFVSCGFSRDEAAIRIGVSGTGQFPNYCIEEGFEQVTLQIMGLRLNCDVHRRREVFSGRSHRAILEDQRKGHSWSSAAMTFVEIRTTLGKLRGSRMMH